MEIKKILFLASLVFIYSTTLVKAQTLPGEGIVVVDVNPPTCTLTPTPSTVTYNGSSNINWTVMNASSCTINGTAVNIGTPPYSTGPLTATTSYTMSCTGSSSQTGSCSTSVTVVRPDLLASAPTQNTATIGTAKSFTSIITNSGSGSTGTTFANSFQIATAAAGSGTISTITSTPSPMPVLATSATNTATGTYTFTGAPGTYSVRACADSASAITESSEANNCSAWTNVTVSVAPFIDLTASSPTQNTATIGTPITFSSNIKNNGTKTTGATFYNAFQVATGANGVGPISPLVPASTSMAILAAGATSSATSTSYTFTGAPGTYSVRACADANTSMVGSITESVETNNCSAWLDVVVSNVLSCGSTHYNCSVGATSINQTESATTWDWVCQQGATPIMCSETKPLAGVCGATHSSCILGVSSNPQTYPNAYTWQCKPAGGTTVLCYESTGVGGASCPVCNCKNPTFKEI